MHARMFALSLALAALPLASSAQTGDRSSNSNTTARDVMDTSVSGAPDSPPPAAQTTVGPRSVTANANDYAFSRIAFGGGFSIEGIDLLAATNVNRYLDVRGDGRFFKYTAGSTSTNGFVINPELDLASAGISLDVYPFPSHGFRVTPGLLFYNSNAAGSGVVAEGGTSFTVNHVDYYSSNSNPVTGNASVNLHSQNPAFTLTTGWGSFFPSRGGHWSFPFEIGAAFTGAPNVAIALTSGQVCSSPGVNCADVTSDPQLQSDLQAQIAKYKHDLDPLKVFPILGGGVVYNFDIRTHSH